MSFDPRPSKLVCAVTGANAPDDVYNAFIEFEKGMDDPELVQALRYLEEEWVVITAARLIPNPEYEAMIEDRNAQIAAQMQAGGATQEQIDGQIAELDEVTPDRHVVDYVRAIVSPQGLAALKAVGVDFDGEDDEDDEPLNLDLALDAAEGGE